MDDTISHAPEGAQCPSGCGQLATGTIQLTLPTPFCDVCASRIAGEMANIQQKKGGWMATDELALALATKSDGTLSTRRAEALYRARDLLRWMHEAAAKLGTVEAPDEQLLSEINLVEECWSVCQLGQDIATTAGLHVIAIILGGAASDEAAEFAYRYAQAKYPHICARLDREKFVAAVKASAGGAPSWSEIAGALESAIIGGTRTEPKTGESWRVAWSKWSNKTTVGLEAKEAILKSSGAA